MNTAYLNSVSISPTRRVWNAASDLQENGKRLTIRAIQKRGRISSTAVVAYHLAKLRHAGYVSWTDGKSGTLRVLTLLCTMVPQQAEAVAKWDTKHPAKEVTP